MKATTGPLPSGPDWAYELKLDGMRLLVEVATTGVRAWSSNGREATATFPEVAALGPALAPLECLLDGEVVAFDSGGRPSFERLQHRMHIGSAAEAAHRAAEVPIELVVFDLLRLGDRDTSPMPWHNRRHLLDQLADQLPAGVSVATVFDDGERLLEACEARGLEGVIAKRRDTAYVPGTRSRHWVKVKVRRHQEVVVGGWAPGEGRRSGVMGSLLVGYYDNEQAASPVFRYAGRVGSGLTDHELGRLAALLAPLASDVCPFEPPPPPLVAREAHWVRPEVVVEVEFGHWTDENRLRHPVYLGQRIDTEPTAVIREPEL
jgi:bifunctional non-homologous end joining protein LigD